MGKQPSAIIIIRHGARLDQVDKNWANNAERPYDPPLSYGGWIQCQTLGARINKELQSLEDQKTRDDLEREDHHERPQPHKRRKVIIHTSPYLRCIQTSTAIAAGLRYPQQVVQDRNRPLPATLQRSSLSRPSPDLDSQRSPPTPSDAIPRSLPPTTTPAEDKEHYDLKIDPYLGEWLSPSYFEEQDKAAPPPASELVERAKVVLRHPAEEIKGVELAQPAMVESPVSAKDTDIFELQKSGLRAMAAIGHALPHRTRHTSFGQDVPSGRQALKETLTRPRSSSYSPPIPTYALAPQDPIPTGYFAHARDACVDADMAWDSIAMGWGNGGEYPEEWSAMHRRMRTGLQKMMIFYEDYSSKHQSDNDDQDDNSEDELVLILVTHQAGANALIRLITGAPALHDIGTASLTLAVRRPVLRRQPSLSNTSHSPLGLGRLHSRRGSLDMGLADDFEMRIIASTEHLRAGSNPLGLNSPRLGRSPAFASRRLTGADSLEGFSIGDPLSWRSTSAGTVARKSSQRSYGTDSASRQTSASTGLWGSPSVAPVKEVAEVIADSQPMSPRSRPASPGDDAGELSLNALNSPTTISRRSTTNSTGLWGGSASTNTAQPALGNALKEVSGESRPISRARSPKRRWTAMENSP